MLRQRLSALILLAVLECCTSCSRPLCEVSPEDGHCTVPAQPRELGEPAIAPRRLHYQTGGTLDITNLAVSATIMIEQAGRINPVALPPRMGVEDSLRVQVTPGAGFSPGRANIIITQNGKIITQPLWLYANPSFQVGPNSKLDNNDISPIWAAVSDQQIYIMHQDIAGSAFRHIFLYGYLNNAIYKQPAQPWNTELPNYAKAAIAKKTMIQLRQRTGNANRVFVGCGLINMGICSNNSIVVSDETPAHDVNLAADDNEEFFAFVQRDGTPAARKIMSGEPTELSIRIDGSPMDATPITHLAIGDLNGDARGDLLVWQSAAATQAAARVFLRGATTGLNYDPQSSAQLQEQLGSGALTALAVQDLDGDGLADIVAVIAEKLVVVINQGNGFMRINQGPQVASLISLDVIALGDVGGPSLNGKSATDIIVLSKANSGNAVTIINQLN